ncbi:glycosyltransferase [Sinomonas atrocyanea]|uniref:glycosyltransferase n=1 Tax=Sinomonas atrocyanea TaxID=37927 RepID=UPI003594927E
MSLRRGDDAVDLRCALREIADADVVVVHQYFLWWIAPIVLLSTILRTPVVVTPHGSLTSHQQKFSVIKKRIFESVLGWWVRSNLAGWVTGSQIEKDDLVQLYPEKPVAVGGVGTALPEEHVPEEGWNTPLRLLALSRIAPKKRHDLMIGALRRLIDYGVDAELDIVGTGPSGLVDELRSHVFELGLSDRVHFRGQKAGPGKASSFRAADIYLLPSDDENFGISLAEALAYGVPAVVSSGVASSKFMDSRAGRVLTAPTPDSIARAVIGMVSGSRRQASASARACAESSFSWRAVALCWVESLVELTRDVPVHRS